MYASPLGRASRVVNMTRLGHALTELGAQPDDGPPVKALFVYNSNRGGGGAQSEHGAARSGCVPHLCSRWCTSNFLRIRPTTPIYVLPATTFLEHTDLQGAYGHYYVQLSDQRHRTSWARRGPNVWLFGQLGQRMGFAEQCFRDS